MSELRDEERMELETLETTLGELFDATASIPSNGALARLERRAAVLSARPKPETLTKLPEATASEGSRRWAAWALAAAVLMTTGLSLSWGRVGPDAKATVSADALTESAEQDEWEKAWMGADVLAGVDDDLLGGLDPWSGETEAFEDEELFDDSALTATGGSD